MILKVSKKCGYPPGSAGKVQNIRKDFTEKDYFAILVMQQNPKVQEEDGGTGKRK